ncbi:MAG TPA: MarR family winged helix-turn-helix transcriptional regulator [Terriglobia bacterium]|nr:MarR family winged helix-turn-helix transcriptional regulator [Terriglobia bacterium]
MKRIATDDYRALAAFRYHIRKYLNFSDSAARSAGLEPKQYELLLAIKGVPEGVTATVGALAEQLDLRHHSTVELVNRAEEKALVRRRRFSIGRSYVMVELTSKGDRALNKAVALRLKELRRAGPLLANILSDLSTVKAP